VLFGTQANGESTKSGSNMPAQMRRCGEATKLIYAFLDPRSGNQVRAFRCECGERVLES
jgi:hypothetical protein